MSRQQKGGSASLRRRWRESKLLTIGDKNEADLRE